MNNVKIYNVKMNKVKMNSIKMNNAKINSYQNAHPQNEKHCFFLFFIILLFWFKCFGIIVVGQISSPYQLNKSTIEAER
jgi:hypothetical protein